METYKRYLLYKSCNANCQDFIAKKFKSLLFTDIEKQKGGSTLLFFFSFLFFIFFLILTKVYLVYCLLFTGWWGLEILSKAPRQDVAKAPVTQ
jgi:hypothetical protein